MAWYSVATNPISDIYHGNGRKFVQDLSAADVPGNALGLPHVGDDPATPDTSALNGLDTQSTNLQNSLAAQRANTLAGATAAPGGAAPTSQRPPGVPPGAPPGHGGTTPPPGGGNGTFTGAAPQIAPPMVDQTYIDQLRNQQNDALGLLRDAANGTTPSAAEIAGKNAASQAAAQQFALASALQGGMSAGGALRQASQGSASILSQNANDMAALRAKEMADARAGYATATGNARGQEQDLALDTAKMGLDAAIANQNSKLTAMGLDERQIEALLVAQMQAMGFSKDEAIAKVNASAMAAAAKNARDSEYFKAGASLLA